MLCITIFKRKSDKDGKLAINSEITIKYAKKHSDIAPTRVLFLVGA